MENFDAWFANQVRNSFENFEEPVDSAAFAKMQAQLGPKISIPSWIFSAAALFLVAIIFAYWNPFTPQEFAKNDTFASEEGFGIGTQNLESAQTDSQKSEAVPTMENAENDKLKLNSAYPKIQQSPPPTNTNLLAANSHPNLPDSLFLNLLPIVEASFVDSLIAELSVKNSAFIAGTPVADVRSSSTTGEAPPLFISKTSLKKQNSINFQVAAGSMVHSQNGDFQQGAGYFAGVLGSYSISKRVKFSAGGLLSQNGFSLNPNNGVSIAEANAEVELNSLSNPATYERFVQNEKQVELLALDIPINVEINAAASGKSKVNFKLGISSLLFFQQSFTDKGTRFSAESQVNASSGEVEYSLVSDDFQATEEIAAFQRLDGARIANLGISYNLKGVASNSSVEFFVKIPLVPITSQELQFTMTGISVSYNFGRRN